MKVAKRNPILAWHFLRGDRCLNYPPHDLVTPGQKLVVDPPLALCNRGLHASTRAIDALQYAPGSVVQRVRLWGVVEQGEDKLCAQYRECLWIADGTTALREFACDVAERALLAEREAGREPDAQSFDAIRVGRAWIKGEATAADLWAAERAAQSAAQSAAESAAEWAAQSAAQSAAAAARWAVRGAWSAAWWAAQSAAARWAVRGAWSAAWWAAQSAANELLEARLLLLESVV